MSSFSYRSYCLVTGLLPAGPADKDDTKCLNFRSYCLVAGLLGLLVKTTLNVVIAAGSEHCAAGGKGGESAVQDRLLHAHPLPTLGHGQDPPLEGFLPPRSSDFVTKCLNTKTTKHIPLHLLQT